MTAFLSWHQPRTWYIDRRTRNRMMHVAHGNGPKGRGKKGANKSDSRSSAQIKQDTNHDDHMDIAEQVRMVLPEAAVLRAQSVLLQEDWSAGVKPPQNLDATGGVSLTAKNWIPEIVRRVGWTSNACAILTVQQPSELGLHGFPRQRVQCRISVMTETGVRKEIMVERWLIQLGYGQPVVQKMQGELVSVFVTMKSCIAKFSPRFGWPVGQIGASIAANEIFKHIPEPAVADITPREAQSVAFLVHSDYCPVLLKSSGIDGVFYKYRKDPDATEFPLLWLPEETSIDTALHYAKAPEALGVVEKSSAQDGRLALRFENITILEKFAQEKGIHNNSLYGRWKVTGTPAEIGVAGAAAFLAGQQWKGFDILFVDAGHFVFIAPSVGNHHPMHFVYQGVSRLIHWKAVNAKAKTLIKAHSVAAASAAKGPLEQAALNRKSFLEKVLPKQPSPAPPASPKNKEGEKRPGTTGSTPESKATRSG